jgi:Uma2 family endonuclease
MGKINLDLNKTYTYADYLKWSFDETIELIRGLVVKMAPAPGLSHQIISRKLTIRMGLYFENKNCQLFSAPFDVRLPLKKDKTKDVEITTVVQPDLCVVCDPQKLDPRGCIGAPDLIIEIVSPGNTKKELKQKFEVYQESGVKEYWLVLSAEKSVIIYTLNEVGVYVGSKPYIEEDTLSSPQFPGMEIDLSYVFAD